MRPEKHEILPLPYPDIIHIREAEGWLGLGNVDEAIQSLQRVSLQHCAHPEVLMMRWQICGEAQNWEECLVIAQSFTEEFPTNPCGWIMLSQTLYYAKRVADAYEIASAKTEEFPESSRLLYTTACYACRLGKRKQAEHYLHLAMAAGDAKAIKRRAMKEPDLEALWSKAKMSIVTHAKP